MLPYFRRFLNRYVDTYNEIRISGLFQVDGLNCCADSHIGRCIPGSEDDTKCDNICKQNCKGGHCKIIGKTPPNHFCHCLC